KNCLIRAARGFSEASTEKSHNIRAVVRKDTLISRVWPNRNVEETALQAQISALRDIFGADRDLIRTVRGRGFLFAGNLRDPLAGPLEQPIAASISADAVLGEPRDRVRES